MAGIGEAGGSAEEEAQRRRAQAARLRSQATELEVEAVLWSKGAFGERAVADRLSRLPREFAVLHDLRIPGSPANVDHVVIGPAGVFVIDAKNYSAQITFNKDTLWSGTHPLHRELRTVKWETSKIDAIIGRAATPVLCIVTPKPILAPDTVAGVTVRRHDQINSLVIGGAAVLDADQMRYAYDVLVPLVQRPTTPTVKPDPPPRLPAPDTTTPTYSRFRGVFGPRDRRVPVHYSPPVPLPAPTGKRTSTHLTTPTPVRPTPRRRLLLESFIDTLGVHASRIGKKAMLVGLTVIGVAIVVSTALGVASRAAKGAASASAVTTAATTTSNSTTPTSTSQAATTLETVLSPITPPLKLSWTCSRPGGVWEVAPVFPGPVSGLSEYKFAYRRVINNHIGDTIEWGTMTAPRPSLAPVAVDSRDGVLVSAIPVLTNGKALRTDVVVAGTPGTKC